MMLCAAVVLVWPRPAPPPPVETVQTAPDTSSQAVAAVPAQDIPAQEVQATLAPSAPTPDPAVVYPARLREVVFAPFRRVQGRFGIVVKDLSTGYEVRWNDHYPFYAASLYKLPVMYEVFKQRDLGTFSLSEDLTITDADVSMDLGTLPWPAGTRITIGTALERMVTISDNSGAVMLTKKVGTWRINDDAEVLGMEETHIGSDDLQTSAADMARLLEIIARGQAISPETSGEMVQLMARQQVRDRIPMLIPPEATIANKTGNWNNIAHDAAIVYGPRSTLVIAFMSEGIVDIDALYEAMSEAARAAYDLTNDPAFGASPNPALPPMLVSNYATAPKPPSGGAVNTSSSSSQTTVPRPAAAPTTVAVPADKPRIPPADTTPARVAQPTLPSLAPPPTAAPATPAPASAPAAKPTQPSQAVPKPIEKPSNSGAPPVPAAAPAGTPAVKPQMPSIFAPPPTKTP